jgi:predicted nucleic acid-binding protein
MSADLLIDSFIDTNILVYAFDHSAGEKHAIASQLLRACWENETGCLSIQILQEFFVTVTRKIASPLEHPAARQIVSDLGQWRVHTPQVIDLLDAIDLQERYHLSFWDAMVLRSAACLGCTQLFSEVLGHGQVYGRVRVINPFLPPPDEARAFTK